MTDRRHSHLYSITSRRRLTLRYYTAVTCLCLAWLILAWFGGIKPALLAMLFNGTHCQDARHIHVRSVKSCLRNAHGTYSASEDSPCMHIKCKLTWFKMRTTFNHGNLRRFLKWVDLVFSFEQKRFERRVTRCQWIDGTWIVAENLRAIRSCAYVLREVI